MVHGAWYLDYSLEGVGNSIYRVVLMDMHTIDDHTRVLSYYPSLEAFMLACRTLVCGLPYFTFDHEVNITRKCGSYVRVKLYRLKKKRASIGAVLIHLSIIFALPTQVSDM